MLFYMSMGIIGVVYMVGAINDWTWLGRLDFLPGISWQTKRKLYFIVGFGGVITAVIGILSEALS
ncbi:MAG: hypothetical protein RLP44_29185 [Aggregatilineales bacterium]